MTPDQAAALAIKLFSQDATLCERHPTKMARTQTLESQSKAELQLPSIVVATNYSNSPSNEISPTKSNENDKNKIVKSKFLILIIAQYYFLCQCFRRFKTLFN